MTEYRPQRFNKVLRELNISLDRAVEFLANKGIDIDPRPTAKISQEVYTILSDEFQTDASKKVASKEIGEEKRKEKEEIRLALEREAELKRLEEEKRTEIFKTESEKLTGPKMVGKIDIEPKEAEEAVKEEAPAKEETKEAEVIRGSKKLQGLKQVGKIEVEETGDAPEQETEEQPAAEAEKTVEPEVEKKETLNTEYQKLSGPKKTGETIDLSKFERDVKTNMELYHHQKLLCCLQLIV